MPPKSRSSSRLRSVPPDANGVQKPVSRKRAASVAVDADDQKAPPRKRGRPAKKPAPTDLETIDENIPEETSQPPKKPASTRGRGRPPKSAATLATAAAPLRASRPQKPLARGSRAAAINTIPEPASHPKPPRLCFIFGDGDFGQFGLGTETLGSISRPRLHAWFETAAKGDTLGSQGAGIEKISAGGMHTLAVDEVGKVWSWGINDNAALGRPTNGVPDPDNSSETLEPEILETQPMVVQSLVNEKFRAVDVSAGDSVSVALGQDGDLRAWGSFRSSEGLLGFDGKLGSSKTQIKPSPIAELGKFQFVQVACGDDHVLALTTAGHVYTWGAGQSAQLGRRIIERRKINGLSPERLALRNIVLIGTGSFHSFAVNQKGTVYAWGLNISGQTGVPPESSADGIIWQPTEVPALSPAKLGGRRVLQITGGEHHSLFLLDDGTVMGCGRCDEHQVGLADDHPAMIDLEARKAEAKKAAAEAAEAMQKAHRRSTTGAAAEDEGDDEEELSPPSGNIEECIPEPVVIPFPPLPTPGDLNPALPPHSADTTDAAAGKAPANPITYISARGRHNLAVSRAGHAYGWGLGVSNQLGLGPDVETQAVPTRVRSKAMEGWSLESAAAGSQHCLLVGVKAE